MKIGIIFHKNPLLQPVGIDIIRLSAISKGLLDKGIETEILAPVEREGLIDGVVPVRNIQYLESGFYDIIKTCYHFSIDLAKGYKKPIVSRIVRVVDSLKPERDSLMREYLLRCQAVIARQASCVVVNNIENINRWRALYGNTLPIVRVPTGCPSVIPAPGKNPFGSREKIILFLGSLAAPRMISVINEVAQRLKGIAKIHFIGSDKSHLYPGKERHELSYLVVNHGELPEYAVWDYIYHAHLGLAIATSPDPFDNDMSKILSYLRGGLPVVSEEPIVNNTLIRETGFGLIFKFDDMEDLTEKIRQLLKNQPPPENKQAVMTFMAQNHSWAQRVDVYVKLFNALKSNLPAPDELLL